MDQPSAQPFLLFQFHDQRGRPQSLRFSDPVAIVVAQQVEQVRPALRRVQEGVAAGLYAAGYLAYEAAPAFDPAFRVRDGATIPLLWFGLFRAPIAAQPEHRDGPFHVAAWQPTISRADYDRDIAAVHEAIARGDTYQVNYTMRLRTQFAGDDFAFYRRLHRAQHAAYCAYLNMGRYRLLSASPELFFRWHGDQISARPMKGTARRGRWPAEDAAAAAWLADSEKNRAENLMIVDLLRNDLGRVASVGSVHVPNLFAIEPYRTVFQMTSSVAATVRPGTTLEDVFAALFPCGSITGAPKVSTMSLIAELEDLPRQSYCGSIGVVTPGGDATFNVAIRTVLLDTATGVAEYGVGGGITWDSTAEDEYAEALNKAALLAEEWPAFELLETIRLENGEYALLERHLQRLCASARYFDIPVEGAALRTALAAHARTLGRGRWRVRLLVAEDGRPRIESAPFQPLPDPPLPVALAHTPISRQNRFLFHKTTNRAVYDTCRAAQPDAFDVLLWNEQGELTEFTLGNIVLELDGQRWTPPRDCGLLDGTLRAELLDQGELHERVLRRADLAAAERIWLINSVRGWVHVQLVE
jgi:para-aminobenzoate synthetase/4-amino-4-deoxychorismate lyase